MYHSGTKHLQYFILLKNNFLCLFLAVLGLRCSVDFSTVAANRGYSLVSVCSLLIAVASFAVEHGLWGARASVLAAPGF